MHSVPCNDSRVERERSSSKNKGDPMRPRFYFVIAATILFSMCPFPVVGDTERESRHYYLGGLDHRGHGERRVSLHYDPRGDHAQYNDLFDLHKGFRLMDVNLTGRAPAGTNLFADSYSVTASGLGGDPYQSGQLTVRKDKLYDLTVNFRQSYYYWSQNNNASQVVAGTPPSPAGLLPGLPPIIAGQPSAAWAR